MKWPSMDTVTSAIGQLIADARAEGYAEGVRDGENKTGDGLYRRILIAATLSGTCTVQENGERRIRVDMRYEGDATLDRWIIVDDGIDPTNGIFRHYILRQT